MRDVIDDTDRLLAMVEQVLRATAVRSRPPVKEELDFCKIVRDTVDLARLRHHLGPDQLKFDPTATEPITILGARDELATAVANLVGVAPLEDRDAVVKAIRQTFASTAIEPLALGKQL